MWEVRTGEEIAQRGKVGIYSISGPFSVTDWVSKSENIYKGNTETNRIKHPQSGPVLSEYSEGQESPYATKSFTVSNAYIQFPIRINSTIGSPLTLCDHSDITFLFLGTLNLSEFPCPQH